MVENERTEKCAEATHRTDVPGAGHAAGVATWGEGVGASGRAQSAEPEISISRLNITADNDYNAQDEATYKMLLKKTTKLHQKDYSRNYYGRPDYEEVKDSIEIGGNLPLGAYLMEVTSDNTGIAPQRELFYVSNLAVMIQQLPDDKHRYVVVNATDGQPIAGAKIELYDQWYDSTRRRTNERFMPA